MTPKGSESWRLVRWQIGDIHAIEQEALNDFPWPSSSCQVEQVQAKIHICQARKRFKCVNARKAVAAQRKVLEVGQDLQWSKVGDMVVTQIQGHQTRQVCQERQFVYRCPIQG